MYVKFQRTFYPIGQGAFYGEKFYLPDGSEFNMVYDCGSLKPNPRSDAGKRINKIIEDFSSKIIDILFISHFHEDHINKIKLLSQNREIKRVVLPFLYDEYKANLVTFNKFIGNNIVADFLINPQEFFNQETQIIYVNPMEEGQSFDEGSAEISIDELQRGTNINSGTQIYFSNKIGSCNKKLWLYIPFNLNFSKGNSILNEKLKELKISQKKMEDKLPKNEQIFDIDGTKKKVTKKMREIYSEIESNINNTSMIVLSTSFICNFISNINLFHRYKQLCCQCRLCHHTYHNKCGCLYTGDITLEKILNEHSFFKMISSKHFHKIGTIQVSHHGSIDSFNIDFFNKIRDVDNISLVCPISFGLENNHGHPSMKVLQQLLREGYYPVLITEDKDSVFIDTYVIT